MEPKKDSAQVLDFVEKFKTQKDLQEYAKAQFITLMQTNKRVSALEKENSSLKSLLQQVQAAPSDVQRIPKTPEQMTCELEIEKLQQSSLQRELDLNEVRKLEILVKTLYSAKAKSQEVAEAQSKPIDSIEETDLLKIASEIKE